MISESAFVKRIVIGKSLGFVVGLISFFVMPILVEQITLISRLGVLCWYTTFGAVVAMAGCVKQHPLFGFPMPWWLMGSITGAWLNLVLALMFHEHLEATMVAVFGEDGLLRSAYWIVLEGMLIGLAIAGAADRATQEADATPLG